MSGMLDEVRAFVDVAHQRVNERSERGDIETNGILGAFRAIPEGMRETARAYVNNQLENALVCLDAPLARAWFNVGHRIRPSA